MNNNITRDLAPLRISEQQAEAIRAVPHFCDSQYKNLDVEKTLEHFRDRYILNAPIAIDAFAGKTVVDLGCGYGWLAMAYANWTDARVVAIELDAPRLEAGRRIAAILGLAGRIGWSVGSVTAIPLADRAATIMYCIEVLEHIDRDRTAFSELQRVAETYLVLTTPNLLSPVIGHDTQLPFCHWLPFPLRHVYATLFGRQRMNQNNLFWSATTVARELHCFRRISGFLHYRSLDEYLATFPYYSPYGTGSMKKKIARLTYLYLKMMSLLGPNSHLIIHNLAGTFQRRSD
jgi:ubiquinone/menaquinone biosynthesis C-methylase UbiE